MTFNGLFSIFAIVVFVSVISYNVGRYHSNYEPQGIVRTDTITITDVKTDTIILTNNKYINIRTIDTIYVTDSIYLPIVQKVYLDSAYKAVISGIEPLSLDSIEVYQNTITNYVITEKINTIYDKSPVVYLSGGINACDGTFMPNVGVYTSVGRKWLYGAEIGLYGNCKFYGGIKLGIKIN